MHVQLLFPIINLQNQELQCEALKNASLKSEQNYQSSLQTLRKDLQTERDRLSDLYKRLEELKHNQNYAMKLEEENHRRIMEQDALIKEQQSKQQNVIYTTYSWKTKQLILIYILLCIDG
jgi:hypothetical protein